MNFPLLSAIAGITAAVAYAVVSVAKLRFTRHALRGIPPEQRVEVIDAVGRALQEWGPR